MMIVMLSVDKRCEYNNQSSDETYVFHQLAPKNVCVCFSTKTALLTLKNVSFI